MSANPSLSSPVRDAPSDLDAVSIPRPAPDRTTSPVVEVESLDKIYEPLLPWQKGVQALTEVTLSIYPGEVFGLVGPNRAGKTTFLKILLSLCWPTSGQVTRFGEPAACRRTLKRVGYMHEDQVFPLYLTASGLLEYYGTLSQLPLATLRERIPQLLEHVQLADRQQDRIGRFSKGMLRRCALAQALINEPDLLVLDEPTEGLDQAGRKLLHSVVKRKREEGKTTLIVSHILSDVELLCDRVGVIKHGRLLTVTSMANLTKDPQTGRHRSLSAALDALYEDQD